MFGRETILNKTPEAGGCTNTVDLYNPFPDGGGVALYQLNGDATDESGNYDGTWGGTASYGTGVFGQAAVLNGSNNYINLGNGVSTLGGLFGAKNSFTVSLWFKTGTTTMSDLFSDFATNSFNCIIEMASNGTIDIVSRYSGTTYAISSTNSYNDNSWHNVVVTFDSGTNNLNFYVDNIFIASQNTPNAWNGTTDQRVTIGANYYTNSSVYQNYLNGSIDQVRIFSRALRPYEIEALYTEEYCTPTIVPSEHFNTVTYTGTGASRSITGVGFQPDFTWIKGRTDSADYHNLFDSVRGADKVLISNLTNAEYDGGGSAYFPSFDADGFSLSGNSIVNGNTQGYVAWNFKAGGSAVTNTDGTITSQVSANTEAGFSIVTGSVPSSGFTNTYGHGLNDTPKIVISKVRNNASDWFVSNNFLANNCLKLNTTAAAFSDSAFAQTSTTIKTAYTTSAYDFVAYCFAEVEGFSNFGSYVGTGASGNTVVTGFEPAFVMVKRSSSTGNWVIFDNKRDAENPRNKVLYANEAVAEQDLTTYEPKIVDFVENGFVIQDDASNFTGGTNFNISGSTYIYMAFAADPTTIEPSLEDSFNTVLYTGVSGTDSVTGVGFQPDLVWVKNRTTAVSHVLFDSVRGSNKTIYSNLTNAEDTQPAGAQSFLADGFSFSGEWPPTDAVGNNYVMWCWKAAELPAINSNGSIKSVVSANPAAGFSIVSYTGNGTTGATFGHGLDTTPKAMISKRTDIGDNWNVYTEMTGNTGILYLNLSDPFTTVSNRFNNTSPTDTVFTLGNSPAINNNNGTYIAYCFAEVAGFSKFGSYSGSNSAITIYTTDDGTAGGSNPFEPAFIMTKRTNSPGGSWIIQDNKRITSNGNALFPDLSAAESLGWNTSFNSNGFTISSNEAWISESGGEYIYMAFANQF